MNLWVTSDTHFGHANMLKFLLPDGVTPMRPFGSVEEVDELMVERWNEVVRPQDHCYHLGDVAMRQDMLLKFGKRLHGHKRLVRGNHDIFRTKWYLMAGFEEIYGVRVLDNLLMTHIPVHPQSLGRFKANVHGHIHNNHVIEPVMKIDKQTQAVRWTPYLNVCVEVTNYRPLALEELNVMVRIQEVQNEGNL